MPVRTLPESVIAIVVKWAALVERNMVLQSVDAEDPERGKSARMEPRLVDKAIDYAYADGVDVKRGTIAIPANSALPDFPSFFLFAFHKSGSVLVNALVRDLLTECGVPLIDLPTHLFERGILTETFQCNIATLFPLKGYCFSGFRDVPHWLIGSDVLNRARKVVVVRDPRDMLVSLYYSVKYSHWFPPVQTPQFEAVIDSWRRAAELSIDEFCMASAWHFNAIFWMMRMVLRDQDTLVLRYEDFIYDKVGLGKDICRWCGINVPEERIREFAAAHGAIPKGDEPHAHVRQVHPGDHKRKLRPDTIAVLNASLANFLDAFSYEGATRALGRAGEAFQRMSRLILPLRNRLSMRSNTLSMRGWGGGRLASNAESKGRRPDSERQ
jgi:hypothetical protein